MKVELINRLAEAGLPAVEATSFVSPKWVPQLADSAEVMSRIRRLPGVRYPVLTPNMKVRLSCKTNSLCIVSGTLREAFQTLLIAAALRSGSVPRAILSPAASKDLLWP